MTPEQEAKLLVAKIDSEIWNNCSVYMDKDKRKQVARRVAVMCVNKIIESWSEDDGAHFWAVKKYWIKVKGSI